jgi:hypothetical protein
MGNTIVSFRDKFYEYGVDPNPDHQGLTIGGFESAFLADLEASYIFDKLSYILERHVQFVGTYRNDKIIVFWGSRSNEWLHDWLNTFQSKVNQLLCTLNIQFTMEIWQPDSMSGPLPISHVFIKGIDEFKRICVNGDSSFLYLDIKLSWNDKNNLLLSVYKNQAN